MAGGSPEVGDKVSWNWGSGQPGGTVAEKKTEGEIAIKSKRGNTIKKNASPDNPGIHVERSGNDVVKRASELHVEKKGSASKTNSKKREHEEDKEEEPAATEENAEGKEVKAKTSGKKQKTAPAKQDEKKDETKQANKDEKENENKETNAEKKKPGRPKKSEASGNTKMKKTPKPRSTEGIGSRTRSRK